jgi:hypothetical protein
VAVLHGDQEHEQDIARVKAALEDAAKGYSDGHAFNVKGETPIGVAGGTPEGDARARFPLADNNVAHDKNSVDENALAKNTDKNVLDTVNAAREIANAVAGEPGAPTREIDRKARFEKTLKEIGKLPKSHFAREKIADFNKKIRANGSAEDIDQIEAERREYVRALFTNNKK